MGDLSSEKNGAMMSTSNVTVILISCISFDDFILIYNAKLIKPFCFCYIYLNLDQTFYDFHPVCVAYAGATHRREANTFIFNFIYYS